MQQEKEEVFEVMDILRYSAPEIPPEGTPQVVLDAMCNHCSRFLLDVYLLAKGAHIRALLHPAMYSRVMKGWLRVGSIVRVMRYEKDMIVEMETTGEMSTQDVTRVKRDLYITVPAPLYNSSASYAPLLTEGGYMAWDRKWIRYLEEYTTDPECPKGEKKKKEKLVLPEDRICHKNTQENIISGQVILKSRLLGGNSIDESKIMFSFIVRTRRILVKVYVWEGAVRKFFCVQEGGYIVISGFKIKKVPGASLWVGDRMKTDKDTKYGNIREISVNTKEPCGEIKCTEYIEGLVGVMKDGEFTTIRGIVEYISPLLREMDNKGAMRLKEFVYLRVSGTVVRLETGGCTMAVLGIKSGSEIEIRHLRRGMIGEEFVFYVSSVYTQFYSGRGSGPLFDGMIVEGERGRECVEENAMGYIPVVHSRYIDHIENSKNGIGNLIINGIEAKRDHPCSTYIKKDIGYFGTVMSMDDIKRREERLFMDETVRVIVFGEITGANYELEGDKTIGENTFDVSYIEKEVEEVSSIPLKMDEDEADKTVHEEGPKKQVYGAGLNKIEKSIIARIENNGEYIDIQIFQNHLIYETFEESVMDFLKEKEASGRSVYDLVADRIGRKYYFVVDIVRVNDEAVLHMGVSVLEPPVESRDLDRI